MRLLRLPLLALGLALAAVPAAGQDRPGRLPDEPPREPAPDPFAGIPLRGSVDALAAGEENADAAEPGDAVVLPEIAADADEEPRPLNPRAIRQQTRTAEDNSSEITGSTNPPRPPPEEVDDFAALGIRAGRFVLYPAVEGGIGYTTNATGTPGGTASSYWWLAPELTIRSDWSRHEAVIALRGSFQDFTASAADRPAASADATLRLDLAADWSAEFAAGYRYSTQSPTDAAFPAGVDRPPPVHGFNAGAAIARNIGPLLLRLSGTADRTLFEDGVSGGMVVDQGDRTNTVYAGRLRIGSDRNRILQPFVEGETGRRVFDRTVDSGGFRRSATIYALRGGFAYDSAPVLTAEIAAGWRRETPDDPALADLAGFTIDGFAVWSPRRPLLITIAGATTFNPNPAPGSGGSIIREVSIDAARTMREDFTLNATAAFRAESFDGGGTNRTTTLGAGATWKLSRTLWLTARYSHQWLWTPDPAGRARSHSVEVRMRVQR